MTKKQIAVEFLKQVSSGIVAKGYENYIHTEFRHHNAHFKGDRESLLTAMLENARKYPNLRYQALRSLEDSDLVCVHGKVVLSAESRWAVMHIFRFSEGKIIELWETSQEEQEDSPNENGIY